MRRAVGELVSDSAWLGQGVVMDLFAPPDVDEQHRIWRANCGPASVAAVLHKPIADVRRLIEAAQGGRFAGYMHAGHLVDVLRMSHLGPVQRKIDQRGVRDWPVGLGLAVLQIDGPWCDPHVPYKARFAYTHIVASSGGGDVIYDVNAGAWLARGVWDSEVMVELVRDTKRATGWHTSSVIEVSR